MRALGANLLVVSPERPDRSLTLKERHALSFDVLSDIGNVVAKQYGVIFQLADRHLEALKQRGQDLAVIGTAAVAAFR